MSSARRTRQGEGTIELFKANDGRYLAHDPSNDGAWITSVLVVENCQ